MTPIRVLVVDDRPLMAEAIGSLLRASTPFLHVDVQSDPGFAITQIRERTPHVLLMDYVTLTQHGGAETVAQVRVAFPSVKIVILTQLDDEETLMTCLQAGAAASINKQSPPDELVHSVQRVHAGEVLFASEQLVKLLRRSPDERQEINGAGLKDRVTPRECEVLCAFATGASTVEVAEQLHISVHTVRTHLKNAIGKLGARSKVEAIILVLRQGKPGQTE